MAHEGARALHELLLLLVVAVLARWPIPRLRYRSCIANVIGATERGTLRPDFVYRGESAPFADVLREFGEALSFGTLGSSEVGQG